MARLMVLVLICVAPISAFGVQPPRDLVEEASIMFRPVPSNPPDLKENPITPAKVKLGTMLFFDPRLSASQIISCNTCHNVGLGGIDLQETSVGHGWKTGVRNAPTVFNSVFNVGQFWDGRSPDLADQAKQPVQRFIEMNNTPERVLKTLKSIDEYAELFKQAFPTESEPLTFKNVAKAIEAFEATLLTPNSPIDRFMRGDKNAITEKEKEGLALYIDKNCASCHYGVNFGGMGYYIFGMVIDPDSGLRPGDDVGRFTLTGIEHDKYRFRAGPLRNVELTPPYFHSGKVWKLSEAVKIMGSVQLGKKLTDEDAVKIARFLRTLTGEQPKIEMPVLPQRSLDTPKPILRVVPTATKKE